MRKGGVSSIHYMMHGKPLNIPATVLTHSMNARADVPEKLAYSMVLDVKD